MVMVIEGFKLPSVRTILCGAGASTGAFLLNIAFVDANVGFGASVLSRAHRHAGLQTWFEGKQNLKSSPGGTRREIRLKTKLGRNRA